MTAKDIRPWFATPYLHIYEVYNFVTFPANNSKIHVVLYQSGGVIAKDTCIDLGTIDGESWKSVSSNVYYEGSALVGWTLTLEWT